MSDSHIRILLAVAHSRQQQLDDYDDSHPRPHNPGSAARRRDLAKTAARTRARLAAAEARRRHAFD